MCQNKWDEIAFERVPSIAGKKLKKAFGRHQEERYAAYLESVKKGDAKMNVGRLHPHEIVGEDLSGSGYSYSQTSRADETVEAQWTQFVTNWKATIAEARATGAETFKNALAGVDVSGSMAGLPLKVAVSLGLLISELNSGNFAGKFMTFHSKPDLVEVKGDTLHAKVKNMVATQWGGSTNLQATFDVILTAAVRWSIPQEEMPSTLFILSDMQFNQCDRNNSYTNWQAIERKYANAGYVRPRIVFWNLNGSTIDFPIEKNTPNTALVSSFSADLLQLFLDGAEMTPLSIVHKAVNSPRYERIQLN